MAGHCAQPAARTGRLTRIWCDHARVIGNDATTWHHRHGVQIDLAALPDDPDVLQRMLREVVPELQAENEKLVLLIQRLLRHRFGPRSEKLDLDQLQLVLEDEEQGAGGRRSRQTGGRAVEKRRRTEAANRNRGALPAHLPRFEVIIDVESKDCPCCGGALHVIGEDRSEQLDLVPSQLRVKVVCRPRYACRACEGAVVQAPAPERPIDGGMATEALIAHVVVSKFCDFLPLYRQAQMLKRQGIALDRSTLSTWVGRACWWLTPLYELVLGTVLSSDKVFADETTLPVLEPGRGKTKTGRLWCYAVDDRPWAGATHPAAAYVYSEDRRGEHPIAHLAAFRGTLQVDGYAGFGNLVEARQDASIKLAFCWAHNLELFFMWSGRPSTQCWPVTTAAGTPDKSRFARHGADAWGSVSCKSRSNIVERRCVRQEPGMARCPIVWLPLASVGRLLVCSSWQLRPGRATRLADCSVVCPEGHRTFSLLPDFLAVGLSGLLAAVDDSITVAASAKSMEAAADALRGPDVTLPSAVRWLRRRIRAVRTALAHVTPEMVVGAPARESAPQIDLDKGRVLLGLRRSLSPQILNSIPAPLGFRPASGYGMAAGQQRPT